MAAKAPCHFCLAADVVPSPADPVEALEWGDAEGASPVAIFKALFLGEQEGELPPSTPNETRGLGFGEGGSS